MENIDFTSSLINIIITAVIYMTVPVIICISNKKFTKGKARVIAIINSIAGFIVFIILFTILDRDISTLTGTSAFFYGWINYKLLLSDSVNENDDNTTNEPEINYEEEYNDEQELEDLINKLESNKSNE